MANKTLFKSLIGKLMPVTDALNEEQAPAYKLPPQHLLAQYAATGCLNRTFYASADDQLQTVIELCAEVDAEFIAKTAVFCRERGFMKDMPALLTASLSVKDRELLIRSCVESRVQTSSRGVLGQLLLWRQLVRGSAFFVDCIGLRNQLADYRFK